MKREIPMRRHITIGPLRPRLPKAPRRMQIKPPSQRVGVSAADMAALKRLVTTPGLAYWSLRARLEAMFGKVRSS